MSSERGGALIEVMMGALLIALAATAVFKGIDGASAVSSGSKSRAIAAALAQDDQERLRATTPAGLVDLDTTKTVKRSNVDYTVRSTARWVADREAAPNCSAATSRAGYLRINSKVTWPDMRGSKPVVATSLLAPPNGTVTTNRGAMGVKVLDHQGQPAPGVNVSVTGPTLNGTTNAAGCVFWDDVVAGNYSYTASKPGTVDHNGDTEVTRPIGVAGGQTRIDTIVLAPPLGLNVAVRTKGYDGTDLPTPIAAGDKLFLANSKMSKFNGVRSWSLASDTASLTGLFPMQYGAYYGTCTYENNPANQGVTAGVFAPPFNGTQTIYAPMIKVRARYNGSSTGQNGARVKVVQTQEAGGGCMKQYPDAATWYTTATVSGVPGRLPSPAGKWLGFAYGKYRVCAEAGTGSNGPNRLRHAVASVNNTADAGVDLDLNMTTTGGCPAVFW